MCDGLKTDLIFDLRDIAPFIPFGFGFYRIHYVGSQSNTCKRDRILKSPLNLSPEISNVGRFQHNDNILKNENNKRKMFFPPSSSGVIMPRVRCQSHHLPTRHTWPGTGGRASRSVGQTCYTGDQAGPLTLGEHPSWPALGERSLCQTKQRTLRGVWVAIGGGHCTLYLEKKTYYTYLFVGGHKYLILVLYSCAHTCVHIIYKYIIMITGISISVSILYICMHRYLSIYRSIYLSIDRSIDPSIDPSNDRSIDPSIHPSIHRSIHPSIHLSIYLSI